MSELKVIRNGKTTTLFFQGEKQLSRVLSEAGFTVAHPCGGRGTCGKCAVEVSGHVSAPGDPELRAGRRLSCQITLLGDAQVILPDTESARIETEGAAAKTALRPMGGRRGAAVDVGTTTLAAKLFDLRTGECLATAARMNPQTAVSADVMGRIGAAMEGRLEELQEQITGALRELLAEMGGPEPEVLVITGNTTMLYLLTGRDPEPLSHAPFLADTLFDTEMELLGKRTYLPPCMNAFVGADITCAVLASGMCGKEETALLCDVGTNGEIALWHGGTLYVTSTAAGPAFEGAGISCGCGNVPGAIDAVNLINGRLQAHVIGGGAAAGVCGSGLIDAVACGLQTEEIDETGFLEDGSLYLTSEVALQQKDIRSVQLAKAAISAGIDALLDTAGVDACKVNKLYIAGGFGSHLNVRSAAAIGLFPGVLADRTEILGNAALSGAVMTLLDRFQKEKLQEIAACSRHVNLGGNPLFNERYVEAMLF